MTLNESIWRASWNENFTQIHNWGSFYENCECGGYYAEETAIVGFEILIDLKPNAGFVSVKKSEKHVLDHLSKLWENKMLADVTIKCGEKLVRAHTTILASGSPVLAAMFQNNFQEKQKSMVVIKDMESNVLENLLCFIYTGEADMLKNGDYQYGTVADLLIAADKYAVDSLKEECALHLSLELDVENAARYLVLAHLHNSSKLHEAALNFMAENAKAVCSRKDWMDIIKNYPELFFQATQFMIGL